MNQYPHRQVLRQSNSLADASLASAEKQGAFGKDLTNIGSPRGADASLRYNQLEEP